jgi:hypothetical protein
MALNAGLRGVELEKTKSGKEGCELVGSEIIFWLFSDFVEPADEADSERTMIGALDVSALVIQWASDLYEAGTADYDVVANVGPTFSLMPPSNLLLPNVLRGTGGGAMDGDEIGRYSRAVIENCGHLGNLPFNRDGGTLLTEEAHEVVGKVGEFVLNMRIAGFVFLRSITEGTRGKLHGAEDKVVGTVFVL